MPIVRGIDSDNYDGPVPASHYKRLYDEFGVRFNILGLEAQMPYVQAQKQASIEAGLWVPGGYKFLYWVPSDIERMKQACAAQLKIAIDVEYPTNWATGRVVERINQAKDVLIHEGLYGGIYSGLGPWTELTGNDPSFAGDGWWHASWPFGKGVLPPADYLPPASHESPNWFDLQAPPAPGPYAGRRYFDIWQYANTCYLDELGEWDFDLNAMWMDDPAPPQPPPEANYVTGIRMYFKDATEWNLEVLPPPEYRSQPGAASIPFGLGGGSVAADQLHHHP